MEKSRDLLYTHDNLIVTLPSEIIYLGPSILILSLPYSEILLRTICGIRLLNFRYKDSLYALISIPNKVASYDADKIRQKCQSFEGGILDLDLSKYIDGSLVPEDTMSFIVLIMGNIDILDNNECTH